jgi:N-dimethylarginine dimethylaminohydrolase
MHVLMSGADSFNDGDAINVLMDATVPVNVEEAVAEHGRIQAALESAGVTVHKIDAPYGCQDGVYTANWALVRDGKALMARLPNTRQPEEAPALEAVKNLGLEPLILPEHVERFSGQGDALPCGDTVFTQSPFRTTLEAHEYLRDWLGFREVIALQTLPAYDADGNEVTNAVTGWPDSPTYDIDLAIAILKWPTDDQKGLIAYCPEVFKTESQEILANYDGVDKITISRQEALEAFALNLLSTGESVIMNSGAPVFQAEIEAHGLKTIALDLPELRKGGGSIRCSTLTLDN